VCGIAGVYFIEKDHGYSPFTINKFVDVLLRNIEPRGRHATGLVSVGFKGQGIHLEKKDVSAAEFVKTREPIPVGARSILLHTRYATQGDPKENDNNHPVRYRGTYVTHNGVINNDDSVFTDEDLKRYAEVDSEAIAALLFKHGLKDAKAALEKLKGGFAIAAVKPGTSPDVLLLARGGSYPLVVHHNKAFIVWASTSDAIEAAFKATFVDDNGKPLSKAKNFRLTTETIPSGTLWRIKGKSIDREQFNHVSYVRRSNWTGTRSYETNNDNPWDDFADWGRPANLHGSLETEVNALRANNKGKARVMPSFGERTPEQQKESEYCTTCATSVNKADIVGHEWGRMCLDCRELLKARPGPKVPTLDEDVKDDLETYLLLEPDIHVDVLREIAKRSKLDLALIEYLIFRIPRRYVLRSTSVEQLQKALRSLYKTLADEEWEDALWQGDELEPVLSSYDRSKRKREAEEKAEKEKAEKEEKTTGRPNVRILIACETHGNVLVVPPAKTEDGCPECVKADLENQHESLFQKMMGVDGRVDLPCSEGPCQMIGRTLRFKMWVCTKHLQENLSFYQLHDKMTRVDLAKIAALAVGVEATNAKERVVEEREEVVPVNVRPTANVARGGLIDSSVCYIAGCGLEPAAVMPSGYYACHAHARGVKGAKFVNKKKDRVFH
jgi:predicted glutamine amidotransferase